MAFTGGYGVAVLTKDYGQLDSLAWSMVGLVVVLAIAKRIEWPVRKPGILQGEWRGEDERSMFAWRGGLNPMDLSGRPNAIMGESNEDATKFDGFQHIDD